jgi:signal transduction histidine kinase
VPGDPLEEALQAAAFEEAVRARTRELEQAHAAMLEKLRVQQIEALGRLAAGIAHEINNPLSFVVTNLRFIEDMLRSTAPLAVSRDDLVSAAGDAVIGAERIARIVKDVRIFTQNEAPPLGEVLLGVCVTRAVDMARAVIGPRKLFVDVGPGMSAIGNQEGLQQVLYELISNAAQANAEEIRVRATPEPDGRVRLDVTDNGSGIAPQHVGRVFEPFFTTRPIGSGTGLGLSICHGVVRRMGGDIRVATELGKGSTFSVWLRGASQSESSQSAAEPVPTE